MAAESPEQEELRSLGRWVADELETGPSERRMLRQRSQFVEGLRHRDRGPLSVAGLGLRFGGGILGAVALTAGLVAYFQWADADWGESDSLAMSAEPQSLRQQQEPSESPADEVLSANYLGKSVAVGRWLLGEGAAERLHFGDGSSLTLEAGARVRVLSLAAVSPGVGLESGQLFVEVSSAGERRWRIAAGPYVIESTASRFSLSWEPEAPSLRVEVVDGRVSVRGEGGRRTGRELTAGENLHLPLLVAHAEESEGREPRELVAPGVKPQPLHRVLGGGRFVAASEGVAVDGDSLLPAKGGGRAPVVTPDVVEDDNDADTALGIDSSNPTAAEGDQSGPAEASTGALEPVPAVSLPKRIAPAVLDGWRKKAKAGQYAEALGVAQRVGFQSMVDSLGAEDLLLLADSARLSGAQQQARSALLGLRSRFTGHRNAALAAFTLGRIASEQTGDDRQAVRWFKLYLASGDKKAALAEGARVRLLLALQRLGDQSGARAVAQEYLKHHPRGRQVGLARSVLSSGR